MTPEGSGALGGEESPRGELLVLVKHSVPRIVPSEPSPSWSLSGEGEARCRWLTNALVALRVAAVYSSDEPKAERTARLAAEPLGISPVVHRGLRENDRTGFPFLEDRGAWRERIRELFQMPREVCIGKESADHARARFSSAVAEIVERHPRSNIAVVAHGVVISLFVAQHNELDPFGLWESLTLPSYLVLDRPDFRLRGEAAAYPGVRRPR